MNRTTSHLSAPRFLDSPPTPASISPSTLRAREGDHATDRDGEAGNATSWLAIPSLARLVCGSSFSTRHLLYGKLDVFINLPLKVLQSSPQAARVILGALLNAVYEARGVNTGEKVHQKTGAKMHQ
jgi:Type IV secretory system Conjugative DNA transfer